MINTMPGSMFYACSALFLIFVVFHKLTADKYTQHLILFRLAAIIAAGWLGVFQNNLNNKIQWLSSKEKINVTGTVIDAGNSGFANWYHISLETVDSDKINNFKVIVYSSDYFEKGDVLKLTGKYKGFTPKSRYIYNFSQGVYGYFYADSVLIEKDNTNYISFFNGISISLKDKARELFDYTTVPLAVAMGLGDKSLLDGNVVNAFAVTGLSHALVVSGLHIGFIVAVLNLLMLKLPVYKKLKNIVLFVSVFLFMGIIGFTPSVIRAGCLIMAVTFGKTFIVETDNYTVLAVIILITLLTNPYTAHSGSLLLSYSAYFGVIQGADLARKYDFNNLLSLLIMSAFATLYTTPVLALLGMEMTLLAPFFNLLVSYVIMAICVLSFFLPVLGFVPLIGMPVSSFIAPFNDVLIKLLMWFTEFSQQHFAFAMINPSTEIIKVLIFSIVITILISVILFSDNKKRIIFCFAVPIITLLCYNSMNRDIVTVKVFDGSSQPSYIITAKDKNYLLATENINQNRLTTVCENLVIDQFDEILVCSLKQPDTEMYFEYTESLKWASVTGEYYIGDYVVDVNVKSRQMFCNLDIYGTTFAFNHNKADMSGEIFDFYFFGSDTPKIVEADNYFYFYPVIKKNGDLVTEKQAKELYDILTIKIKSPSGQYSIVEDVKNFGSRI